MSLSDSGKTEDWSLALLPCHLREETGVLVGGGKMAALSTLFTTAKYEIKIGLL